MQTETRDLAGLEADFASKEGLEKPLHGLPAESGFPPLATEISSSPRGWLSLYPHRLILLAVSEAVGEQV